MDHKKNFLSGMRDGIPIALGYFAVAVSLGIAARNAGLTAFQGFLTSILCNASAGQYIGFTMMAAGASYLELAIATLVTNARVPIMPVRFFDRNSSFYYALGLIDWRVRLLRLPAEVFNKAGRSVRIGLAPLISVEEQQQYLATHTIEEFGTWLRSKVYGMEIRS